MPRKTGNGTTAADARELEDAAAAYARVEHRALALGGAKLTALNVDVATATRTMLRAAPRIRRHRRRIVAELPAFDVRNVDDLEDYARAALYASMLNEQAPGSSPELRTLLEEATALRTHLLVWARALAHQGLFDPDVVEPMKDRVVEKLVLDQLGALVALYRSKWRPARWPCGVTMEEVGRGVFLSKRLPQDIKRSDATTAALVAERSLNVRRFWTLADRAYDQCRRVIAFLVWGVSDADEIAPSLRRNDARRASPTKDGEPARPRGLTDILDSADSPVRKPRR